MRNAAARVFASTSAGSTIGVALTRSPLRKKIRPARSFVSSDFGGR